MNDDSVNDDAEDATRLIAYGLRPKHLPARDSNYASLVRRYAEDPEFEHLVTKCASGMGLRIIAITMRSGTVLAGLPGSVFETKMDQFARQARMRDNREAERVLHGITHLAIAALGFPRPEDLADDGYVGRVTATQVDQLVRTICQVLSERAAENDEMHDPPAGAPELERAWRVYMRRPAVTSTKDGRQGLSATQTIVSKSLNYLADRGMLTQTTGDFEQREKIYRPTSRYQLHVRELATTRAYDELLNLGVLPPTDGSGVLRVSNDEKLYD